VTELAGKNQCPTIATKQRISEPKWSIVAILPISCPWEERTEIRVLNRFFLLERINVRQLREQCPSFCGTCISLLVNSWLTKEALLFGKSDNFDQKKKKKSKFLGGSELESLNNDLDVKLIGTNLSV
jgi:hypothetical protein